MRPWPFALEHAVYLWNHLPNRHGHVIHSVVLGVSPVELFTSTTVGYNMLNNEYLWGCPAYIIDPKLQDGKNLPK